MTTVLGAGAFGTALAVALSTQGPVRLWGRGLTLDAERRVPRLKDVSLPLAVEASARLELRPEGPVLLAVPMQALGAFLSEHRALLDGRDLVLCCKGMDLKTLKGPSALVESLCPNSGCAVLTGPSFAADIARGLPTALTLACADEALGARLQAQLSTPVLRLYRSADVLGAELGGALKNVMAIAAGVVVGAGLGDSARAALMTRGYAEMLRFAVHMGARPETLAGLSGFGDLVLTCTSGQSRNFRHGLALGRLEPVDTSATVEGVATAQAILARAGGVDMPITAMVTALTTGAVTPKDAAHALMTRPLREE